MSAKSLMWSQWQFINPRKDPTSFLDFGTGQSIMVLILLGSMETPCLLTSFPRKGTSVWNKQHFHGFSFNPNYLMHLNDLLRLLRWSSKLFLITFKSSRYDKISLHVIPAKDLLHSSLKCCRCIAKTHSHTAELKQSQLG